MAVRFYLEILSKNLEVKALYFFMNQNLKIIKTVFMRRGLSDRAKKFGVNQLAIFYA